MKRVHELTINAEKTLKGGALTHSPRNPSPNGQAINDNQKHFILEMQTIFGAAWDTLDDLQVMAYFTAFREAGLKPVHVKRGLTACRTEWQGDFPPKPGQFVALCKPKKESPPHWQAYTPKTALCASCGRESEHVNTYAAGGYLAAVQCRSCGFSTRTLPKPKKLPPQGVFEKIRAGIKCTAIVRRIYELTIERPISPPWKKR